MKNLLFWKTSGNSLENDRDELFFRISLKIYGFFERNSVPVGFFLVSRKSYLFGRAPFRRVIITQWILITLLPFKGYENLFLIHIPSGSGDHHFCILRMELLPEISSIQCNFYVSQKCIVYCCWERRHWNPFFRYSNSFLYFSFQINIIFKFTFLTYTWQCSYRSYC